MYSYRIKKDVCKSRTHFQLMSSVSPYRTFTITAIAQLCVLGIMWIFGCFQFDEGTLVMSYLFTILNSLQGVLVFIMHCLLSKQVRVSLSTPLTDVDVQKSTLNCDWLNLIKTDCEIPLCIPYFRKRVKRHWNSNLTFPPCLKNPSLLSLGERWVHPVPDLLDCTTEELILRVQHKPVQQIPGTLALQIILGLNL